MCWRKSPHRPGAVGRRRSHVTPPQAPGYKSHSPASCPPFPIFYSPSMAAEAEHSRHCLESPVSSPLHHSSSTKRVVCTSPSPLTYYRLKESPDAVVEPGIRSRLLTTELNPPHRWAPPSASCRNLPSPCQKGAPRSSPSSGVASRPSRSTVVIPVMPLGSPSSCLCGRTSVMRCRLATPSDFMDHFATAPTIPCPPARRRWARCSSPSSACAGPPLGLCQATMLARLSGPWQTSPLCAVSG
jgi:hypothetical protein